MGTTHELTIPDLGDFEDVEIIEILVAVGDPIEAEDGILTLETDKAAMDVPSPIAGIVRELRVSVGDRVSKGDRYAVIETPQDGGSDVETDGSAATEAGREPATQRQEADSAAREDSGGTGVTDIEVRVPDLGDFSDVDVIEVLVAVGDSVALEDGLISLETDKAAMDVPSSHAGTVKELRVSAGDKVNAGDVIVVLEGGAGGASKAARNDSEESGPETSEHGAEDKAKGVAAKAVPDEDRAASPPSGTPAKDRLPVLPQIDEIGFSQAHASPSVRKLARELGVDLTRVKGSGRKNRILPDDVKNWVKAFVARGPAPSAGAALPSVPEIDFGRFGDTETRELTRIQKIAGPRLQASWINLPHVTQHDLADITTLEQRRQELKGPAKEKGISLTPLAFIIRAVVLALAENPKFSSSLSIDGDALILKKYCHIGFAADTPNGLVVPVIRDADKKDIYELASELADLSAAARQGKLKADQLQGAVFTISSLGGIGGTAFTPIVNAPEVAILGVSRHGMQPVWDGSEFRPRLMLPLSLSYDHRVVDGADAVRFTTRLGELLGDVGRLLEALP